MTGLHILLFDEVVHGRFLGFNRRGMVTDLPLWGSYRIGDILKLSNEVGGEISLLSLKNSKDERHLHDLLSGLKPDETIVVGRTGNVTITDWASLLDMSGSLRGIVKVQVGKVPSDLYCVSRDDLLEIVTNGIAKHGISEEMLHYLFESFFFHNFERIVNVAGFSFFFRNSYEYYKENLMITKYLKENRFIEIYKKLPPSAVSHTTVAENAVVKNSMLGNGARIEGVVENSVIFKDVVVGRDSTIKSSVVLPSNCIEEGVTIENALILEGEGRAIREGSRIGGDFDIPNNDYPTILKKGLTVIGQKIDIPRRSRIGVGCLVYGDPDAVPKHLVVEDRKTYVVE